MTAPELLGKCALVTGGGRGLGRAYALQLASMGADVAILDLDLRSYRAFAAEQDQMTADSTALEVEALGRRAIEVEVDVSDATAVQRAVDTIVEQWGRLDIAVCNAGGGMGHPKESLASSVDFAQFDAVVRSNLYGTVHTCVAVAPTMKAQESGKIITVASQAGRRPTADGSYAHYGVAKAGIIMYTKYLAKDLGPAGITVNCIAPGLIETGRLSEMFHSIGVERFTRTVPIRRLGNPDDCARVVGFLASAASDYMTGTIVPIDGGTTL